MSPNSPLPAPVQTTEHAHQHSLQQVAGGEFGVRRGVAPRHVVAEREHDRPAYSGVSSSDFHLQRAGAICMICLRQTCSVITHLRL